MTADGEPPSEGRERSLMHMVMLVLDDPAQLDAVLDAWEKASLPGATIIESTGVHRLRAASERVHARYTFGHPAGQIELGHYTLFTIVPDRQAVERCLAATEAVVGDLEGPSTGILAAWPLALVKGIPGGASADESS